MTMIDKRRNNSAARLHFVFTKLPPQSPDVGTQVWARALDLSQVLESNNLSERMRLVRRLVLLADEIDRVRIYCISSKKAPRLWENQLASLDAALMLQHLEAGWSQNRVRPDAIQLLDMLSDEMPDEGEIEELGADLNDLHAQVRDVIRRIHESSLPADMKLELLRIAQELKDALTNVQITGPLFLQKTVVQVNATLEEMWQGLGVYKNDESVSLFKNLMIKAAKLGPYVERVGRATDTAMRFLDSADRIRKLVSGEPPTV